MLRERLSVGGATVPVCPPPQWQHFGSKSTLSISLKCALTWIRELRPIRPISRRSLDASTRTRVLIALRRGLRTRCSMRYMRMSTPKRSAALAHLVLPTTQHALSAIFEIGEASVSALTELRAHRDELAAYPRDGLGPAAVGAQPEDQPLAMFDQTPGALAQRLHHRLDAPPLGAVPDGMRIGPEQAALSHQSQDVHSQCLHLAHQGVGVELALRQPGEIKVGLELRVELLARGVVRVQRSDVLGIESGWQARHPALRCELGHDQHPPVLVDCALDQTQHSVHGRADAPDGHSLHAQAGAHACARSLPLCGCIGVQARGQRGHVAVTQVPLDQSVHPRRVGLIARFSATHHTHRVKARVQVRQDRHLRARGAHTLCHRHDWLKVQVGLFRGRGSSRGPRRALHTPAQRQIRADPVRTELGRQRAVASHARMGAVYAFLGRAAVVAAGGRDVVLLCPGGVHVKRQPATGQHTALRAPTAGQGVHHRCGQVKPLGRTRAHALAKRRAGGRQSDAQRLLAERVTSVIFDGVEVAVGLHAQASVAARDVAAAHTALDRRRRFESTQHGLHRRQAVPHQRYADHRCKGRSQLSINWRLVFNRHGCIDTDTHPRPTRSITRRQNQSSAFACQINNLPQSSLGVITD